MINQKTPCSLRIEEKDIELAKKNAEKEGISFSEYIRRRIYADPVLEEKLNKILNLLDKNQK